jgi:RHS repeat-associated protein
MKKSIFIIICTILSFYSQAQQILWNENTGFSYDDVQSELESDLGKSADSYILSYSSLASNHLGFVEVDNFLLNGSSLNGQSDIDVISLYFTYEKSFSLAEVHQNSYSITYYGPENVILIKGPNGDIDTITNVTLSTSDVFRIEKTDANRVLLKYNTSEYLIVDNYIERGYIALRTNTDVLSFAIAQNNFSVSEETDIPIGDSDKNWIFNRTFDNSGSQRSAGITYYNSLGKATQSQTRDFKTGKTWANQTFYDYKGRAALSTLSAPLAGTPIEFSYEDEFVLNSSGNPYTTIDFEQNPEIPNEVATDPGTLGWYYSNNNSIEPYQDVTSRPYSRTVFDELNPGLGRMVAGGKVMDLNGNGNTNDPEDGFPQGFSYTVPAAQELYYAFGQDYFEGPVNGQGKEVIAKIYKTVSIDAHGKEIVTFTDLEGKVLATARSGSATVNTPTVHLIGEQGFIDIHYPIGLFGGGLLGNSNEYTIYNLRTGETITSAQMTGGNVYRISHPNPGPSKTFITSGGVINYDSNAKGISIKTNYYDYSLNYYDKAGRLKESVQPLGFDNSAYNLATGTPNHQLISNYDYNALSELKNTASPDQGNAQFVYRSDNQIRFSQNTEQANNEEFSYTNYDDKGRPIESGVCQGTIPYFDSTSTIIPTFIVQDSLSTGSGSLLKTGMTNWINSGFESQEMTGTENFSISFNFTAGTEGVLGLSETSDDGNYDTVEYALYFAQNQVSILNNGDIIEGNIAYYNSGDMFTIERIGNTLYYKKNDDIIFDESPWSDSSPSFPDFLIDGALYTQNAEVSNVVMNIIGNTESTPPPVENFVVNPDNCREQVFTEYDLPDPEGLEEVLYSGGSTEPEFDRVQRFLAGNVSKSYTKEPETSTTWYSYDIYGRVEWMVQFINGIGTKTIDYEYDPATGQVVRVIFQRDDPTERFVHKYLYNDVGELITVETSRDNLNFIEHANYTYYETGALKRINLAEGLQGTDYVYNLSGQLKAINHSSLSSLNDPGQDQNDAFGFIIDYHERDYSRPGTNLTWTASGDNRFDGNIKGVRWGTMDLTPNGVQHAYLYDYDNNNWLNSATFGTTNNSGTFSADINGDYNVSNLSYDKNGNILSLTRNKYTDSGSNAMDVLEYNYYADSNQLENVDDTSGYTGQSGDIKDQNAGNYIYNAIGELIENKQDDIGYSYFATGLVRSVFSTVPNSDDKVDFKYNDRGHRVSKKNYTSSGLGTQTYYVRDAAGQVMAIYTIPQGTNPPTTIEYPIYGLSRLGIADQNNIFKYQLSDHLGNVRAVIQRDGNTSVILEQDFNGISTVPGNWTSSNTTLSIDTINERLKANFTGGSTNNSQASFSVVAGNTYTITFDVDLDQTPNNLEYNVFMGAGSISGNYTATQNGEYTFTFTPINSGTAYLTFSLTSTYPAFENIYYLDNISVINTTTSTVPIMLAYKDYYPFGMGMPNRNIEGQYPYAFQGQEKDPETGMEAFEARLWDARIGRWITIDPAGEFFSPYLGMANNPVSVIDPDGRCTDCPENASVGDTYSHPEFGEMTYTELGGWTTAGGASMLDITIITASNTTGASGMPFKLGGSYALAGLMILDRLNTHGSGSTFWGKDRAGQIGGRKKGAQGEIYGSWEFDEMVIPGGGGGRIKFPASQANSGRMLMHRTRIVIEGADHGNNLRPILFPETAETVKALRIVYGTDIDVHSNVTFRGLRDSSHIDIPLTTPKTKDSVLRANDNMRRSFDYWLNNQ